MLRALLKVLLVLVTLVVLLACAALLYVRSAAPQRGGTLALAGLDAPVEAWRDSLGVPHIWARTEHAMVFAQGCVHAQDRLWQMELLRRAGTGTLAALFGADLVESDRFLRVLGIARTARAEAEALQPEERALLERYAAGVNACMAAQRGALPPEFLLLRTRPEPWTVLHTLVIEHIMAFDLSLYHGAAQATAAVQRIGSGALSRMVGPHSG